MGTHTIRGVPFLFILLLFQGCVSLVTDDQKVDHILIPGAGTEELEYVGNLETELRSWNWLFTGREEERRAEIERQALLEAKELYGEEARIKPEFLSGRWHPASLLMLFGLAGFVEEARLEVSVWLPVPPPEPAPKPAVTVRYRVIPEAEYTSPAEFTTVAYKDRIELEAELQEAFHRNELTGEDLQKKLTALPAGGMISLTYGRSELTNAISRWFTFTLKEEEKQLFRKRGVEDIPYVYGTDNLWWNDLSFPVDQAWSKELQFIIEDEYQNKIYRFRIIKEEI